jgi:hypothetical protein
MVAVKPESDELELQVMTQLGFCSRHSNDGEAQKDW